MRKKLLFIVNAKRISGAEKSLILLLQLLNSGKYDVTVAIPHHSKVAEQLQEIAKIRYFKLKKIQNSFLLAIITFPSIVIQAINMCIYVKKNKVDLIYSNSTSAHLYGSVVHFITGCPAVWHVRDNITHPFLARILGFLCTHIICVSGFIFEQVPGNDSKKSLIYNGVQPDKWIADHNAALDCKQKNFLCKSILIANVGQFVEWKQQADFIVAAELVLQSSKNAKFVLMGADVHGDGNKYLNYLKSFVVEKGLEAYFYFVPYNNMIQDYMNAYDILVHTAKDEPFGRVIIEAMALSKPVIAYRTGGIKEIISHNIDGILVELNEIEDLAGQILQLIQDSYKRKQLGYKARLTVTERFSAVKYQGQVENVIDLCLRRQIKSNQLNPEC